jgi:DNA helicase HerA-like ATPase
VFFFDEAHLLFTDASKAFLERIEQTVKLVRSKGVGVFFCTQLPTDIPNAVLSQLGARVQHALRAFTPEDQTALKKTVKTYPNTKNYDMEEALTSLGTGEAIVTVLSETGAPTPVAWSRMRAPRSLMAAIGGDAVTAQAKGSTLFPKYGTTVDRESAYEKLTARIAPPPPPAPVDAPPPPPEPRREREEPGMVAEVLGSPVVKSFLRSAASALGREITRGLFGTRRR